MIDLARLWEFGERYEMEIPGGNILDIPLARKTLEHIEAHPEEWNQGDWICESGMCYAGHAAHLAGAELVGALATFTAYAFGPESERGIHVSDYARRVLGLGDGEAQRMFYGENTLEDLRGMVESLETKGHLADWGVQYATDGTTTWEAP